MTNREKELEDALRQTRDALVELMACSVELMNSRAAKGLYKQCHEALMASGKVLPPQKEPVSKMQLDAFIGI
jgi:hypothetical protein